MAIMVTPPGRQQEIGQPEVNDKHDPQSMCAAFESATKSARKRLPLAKSNDWIGSHVLLPRLPGVLSAAPDRLSNAKAWRFGSVFHFLKMQIFWLTNRGARCLLFD
jgi:hypothetical protein